MESVWITNSIDVPEQRVGTGVAVVTGAIVGDGDLMLGDKMNSPSEIPLTSNVSEGKYGYTDQAPLKVGSSSVG